MPLFKNNIFLKISLATRTTRTWNSNSQRRTIA